MPSINNTINNGIQLGTGYASPLTITNSGFINAGTSGYNGAAVYAAAPAVLTLVNQGRISIAGTGIAVFEGSAQGLALDNSGTIGAVANAVSLQHDGPVTNSGTILSTGGTAINDGNALQVTNANGGVISGYGVGIKAASGTITNYGTIRGTATASTAVYLNGGGNDGIVSNYGLLSATYDGILFRASGTLSNSGTIASTGRYGVEFGGGTASVTNSGTITGRNALKVLGDGTVGNTGRIVGLNAVAILGAASLSNAGTIDATNGTGVVLGNGGTLSNAGTAVITATGYTGVNVSGGAATITNAGTIIGYTGIAFYAAGTASQTVIDSGTITGTVGPAITFGAGDDLLQLQPGSLLIQGRVDGGGGTNTVEFASAASTGTLTGSSLNLVNFSRGTVDAGADWVLAGSNTFASGFTLTNSGTLTDSGTLTNGGSIALADYHPLQLSPGAQLTNLASGVISLITSHYNAFDPVIRGLAGGPSTVTNLGTIRNGQFGIYLPGGGMVTNGATNDTTALIYAHDGVFNAQNSNLTVVNYGTIVGNYAGASGDHRGVDLEGNGVVINGARNSTAASIIGGDGVLFGQNAGTLVNFGTIRGTYASADGVLMYYGNGGTVIDAGTIIGSRDAIRFGTATRFGAVGNNVVKLYPSSVLIGGVTAAGTNNLLELASGPGIGTVAGIGTTFVDFATIRVDASAYWDITGSNSIGSGVSLLDAGTLINSGTLTNSGTLVDAGTLINAGQITATLVHYALSVSNGGVVTNQASGLIVAAGGASSVGVRADLLGSVTNLGTIQASGAGSAGVDLAGGGAVVNGSSGVATALISGATSGVIVGRDGVGIVVNYGTITAGSSNAVTDLGTAAGAGINNHGLILGGYGAVIGGTAATISNSGTIRGTAGAGAYLIGGNLINGTSGSTAGLITGSAYGVHIAMKYGHTVMNRGTISGGIGIVDYSYSSSYTTSQTVIDSGTIIGTGGTAIQFNRGDDLLQFQAGQAFIQGTVDGATGTNTLEFTSAATTGTLTGSSADFVNFSKATIDSGASWVLAGNNTLGTGTTLTDAGTLINAGTLIVDPPIYVTGTLINSDTISAPGTYTAISILSGGVVSNTSSGVIVTAYNAISASGSVSIANLGTITGTTISGIALASGSVINGATNDTTALISGGSYALSALGAATVTNYAMITASGSYGIGILLQGGGTIVNGASGATVSPATIYGSVYGIRAANDPATVTNYGVIISGTCGCSTYDGVHLGAGGGVTNARFATISGYAAGVFINGAAGSVSNAGLIIGNGTYGAGVELNRGGSVTNDLTGQISGHEFGVVVYRAAGTVTNLGTITGPSRYGVGLRKGGVVVNGASGASSARISGGSAGVILYGGTGTVTNYGTIEGNVAGVVLVAGGTVVGAGVVRGSAGTAMYFGASNSSLVLENGYAITGAITATGTGNVVELLGTAGARVTANYNSLSLISFGTVAFAPGAANYATLKITDNATLPGAIANFVGPHDTVDLTTLSDAGNDATTSFNTLTNVLTVTGDNGSVQLQLGGGSYAGIAWLAQNDGSNGTDITPQSSVSPVIAGTKAGQTVNDHATEIPFSTATITDANPPLQIETLTITLSSSGIATDADGTLSGTGLTKTGTGTYRITANGPAVATSELQALVFTPTAHQVAPGGTVTTRFALAVTDSVGQSASDSTTTVIATAVAHLPVISGTVGNQGVPNQTASAPFSKASISDTNAGATDSVTVTLSAPGNGALSTLSGGSYNAATGVFSISGTPAAVTAALNALMFTPSLPASGFVSTTVFTIAATNQDGTASDSTTNVTSVLQVLGLAAVPLSQISISVTPDGVGFAAAATGRTNEAVIRSPVTGGSYTLPSGYQAGFLGGTASATLTDASVGNALLVGNDGNDSIVVSAGNDSILAGSGNDTLVGGTGNIAIQAGSGNDLIFSLNASNFNISTGSGNDTISAAGAGTVFGGTGSNVLYGAGNATIVSAGARDTVAVLSGTMVMHANGSGALAFGSFNSGGTSLSVDIAGANATVSGGQSSTSVTTGGSSALVFGGVGSVGGALSVVDSGSNTTVSAGDSNTAITLSGSNALVFGRFGSAPGGVQVLDAGRGDTISTGNSAATIGAGNNGLLVFGGSGTLNFIGGAGGATIAAGSGATSITGGSGGTTLYGAAGNALTLLGNSAGVLYAAGAGSESFDARASTVANTLVGGTDVNGANTILGGLGNDTLFAGAGAETLGGGGGADLFSFVSSLTRGSADVVTDFVSNDLVYFSGYGADQAAISLSNAVSSGGNTTLTLSDNTRITFLNVSSASALQGHVFSS